MVLLLTDVFVLLTQVLLWVVVGLFAWYVLLRALPRAFLGGLVLLLLLSVAAVTFFRGTPAQGLLGDIWRIISIPFTPLGIILILLLAALGDLIRDKDLSRMSANFLRVAIPALLILSLPAISYFLAQEAEAEALEIIRPAPVAALPAGARRVIVSLANGTTQLQLRPRTQAPPATAPPPIPNRIPFLQPPRPISEPAFLVLANQPTQLTEKGDILSYTAQLYQEERARGTAPLVIVSTGFRSDRERRDGETPESVAEAVDASFFLQRMGVPPGDIILNTNSPTIHDSAVNVRGLLQQRGINFGNQLILVTDAISMNRAALTFNREFQGQGTPPFTVIPRPTDFQTLPPREAIQARARGRDLVERSVRLSDLLPSADALALSTRVINEYTASLYYFLRGWIRPVSAI